MNVREDLFACENWGELNCFLVEHGMSFADFNIYPWYEMEDKISQDIIEYLNDHNWVDLKESLEQNEKFTLNYDDIFYANGDLFDYINIRDRLDETLKDIDGELIRRGFYYQYFNCNPV